MIRTGSDRNLVTPSEPEQQAKDMKRLLAKAEQQIREFQAQVKHEDGLAADREELKAEIADLKGEIRELIRANREQVENLEALRTENARLKAGAKPQSPSNRATGAVLRESPQTLLS
jgi:chromosome segregation ATPase